MIKFNPIITIIIGIIVTFALVYVGLSLSLFIVVGAVFIGGFIATYFAKNAKRRYAIYEGLGVSLIFNIYMLIQILNATVLNYSSYANVMILTFFIIICAVIGGDFGKLAAKHLRA